MVRVLIYSRKSHDINFNQIITEKARKKLASKKVAIKEEMALYFVFIFLASVNLFV